VPGPRLEPGTQLLGRPAGVQQRPQHHVPGHPGEAVEVGEGHGWAPFRGAPGASGAPGVPGPPAAGRSRVARILAARAPAPNPVSMLTTPTPTAQGVRTASRAARPSKAAP